MTTHAEILRPEEWRVDPSDALPTAQVAALLPWLTVERAAYLGLALLALGLRLVSLGAHPLSDAEAGQALVAWRIVQGQPIDQASYSPLIATLNMIGFFLLGASEFAARLGPALLGVAPVLLPYGLRRHLGRGGALAAALLFSVSPTALYLSRIVNGDVAAAVGGLALTVGLFGWLDSIFEPEASRGQPTFWRLGLAAAGLVMLLTSSPSAYSTLVLLIGFLALAAAVGSKAYAAPAREGLAALRTRLMGWGDFGLILLIALLAVATSLLFNMRGLAATADLLTSWFLGFAPLPALQAAYPAVFLLSLYEPLILLAGLFGLSTGLMRRKLVDLFLGWWFLGGVALDLLRAGRTPGEVLVPLVPLTLLAGLALGRLYESLREGELWQRGGLIALSGLVIGGYAYVELMVYTREGGLTVWLPLAGLALYAVLVTLFAVWYDAPIALRGAALAGVILLFAFTVATAWRLSYSGPTVRPVWQDGTQAGGQIADPRQPLVRAPAAEGLHDLVAVIEQVASQREGDAYVIPLLADHRLGPAVEWQLRRFDGITWAHSLSQWQTDAGDEYAVFLVPASTSLALGEGYAGQDFSIRAFWSPGGLSCQSLVRWIVLRVADTPIVYEKAVLWVEQDSNTVE